MNVTTNGVVAPDIAVAEAAKLLREYFDIVIQELRKLHPAEPGCSTTKAHPSLPGTVRPETVPIIRRKMPC